MLERFTTRVRKVSCSTVPLVRESTVSDNKKPFEESSLRLDHAPHNRYTAPPNGGIMTELQEKLTSLRGYL
jgi:hypothetical protein